MINLTGAVYVENETELLWPIQKGVFNDENKIEQWRDWSYKCNLWRKWNWIVMIDPIG